MPPPGGGNVETEENGTEISDQETERPAHCEIVVVDGLLCSIIKVLSTRTDCELVTAVDSGIPEVEIKESWWKLLPSSAQAQVQPSWGLSWLYFHLIQPPNHHR